MSAVRLPLVGGSNPSRSIRVSPQRTVNMFVELDPEGTFPQSLFGRPGLSGYALAGSAAVRGMAAVDGALYQVVGADVVRVAANRTVSTIGSIGTNSGPVRFAIGNGEALLVDGDRGWSLVGGVLAEVTDGDFPDGATHCAWRDGYFLANDPANGGRVCFSARNDVTDWPATDFFTAERSPDPLVAIHQHDQYVWLFGTETVEPWTNTGNATTPWQPAGVAVIEEGCAAPYSVCSIAGRMIWLGNGCRLLQAVGLQAAPLAKPGMADVLAGYGDISGCEAFVFRVGDRPMVAFTFPSVPKTWVVDLTNGLPYEWETYGLGGRWRPACATFFDGAWRLGDWRDGNIWTLDAGAYTDGGLPLRRERWDRVISDGEGHRRLGFGRFELRADVGVGSAELDPQVMLQMSDDGGRTWGAELWRGLGKVGQYTRRAQWERGGSAYDRVYRIAMTDPAPFTVLAAHVEVT